MRTMREWINQRIREKSGKTKAGLGRRMNLPFPRISEIIKGKRDVHLKELRPLAEYLELPTILVLDILENPEQYVNADLNEAAKAFASSSNIRSSEFSTDPKLLEKAALATDQMISDERTTELSTEEYYRLLAYNYEVLYRKVNGLPELSTLEMLSLK